MILCTHISAVCVLLTTMHYTCVETKLHTGLDSEITVCIDSYP